MGAGIENGLALDAERVEIGVIAKGKRRFAGGNLFDSARRAEEVCEIVEDVVGGVPAGDALPTEENVFVQEIADRSVSSRGLLPMPYQ